ncbi:MAG TPA: preprotein translocase subunit SecE, partial [Longimicrobiaceae bacterium]|nr:preprotein translocase subunit SecE [Longimicrobiaceae bacterium]
TPTTRTLPFEFISDVAEQVRKVTWPDREQLKNSTWVIVVFMFIVAALIFGMDWLIRVLLDLVTSLVSG